MSRKKHIDEFFRDVFRDQGPVITGLDETVFLQNIGQINKRNKRRFGFFMFFSIVGICMLTAGGMYLWNNHHSENSLTQGLNSNSILNHSKYSSSRKNANTRAKIAILNPEIRTSNLVPPQQLLLSSAPMGELFPGSSFMPALTSEAELPPDIIFKGSREPFTSITPRGISARSASTDITHEMLPMNIQHRKPDYAMAARRPVDVDLALSSGWTMLSGSWTASPEAGSHKDMEYFSYGIKTRGTGILSGLTARVGYNRWKLGAGFSMGNVTANTVYSRTVKNIPVIDSATGNIMGYLGSSGGEGYKINSQQSTIKWERFSVLVEYALIKHYRHQVLVFGGINANMGSKSALRPFDINTMHNATANPHFNTWSFLSGFRYQIAFPGRWGLGLQCLVQQGRMKYGMKFGSTEMKFITYSFSPTIHFNF